MPGSFTLAAVFAIQIFVLTDFAPLPLLEMQVLGMGRRDLRQVARQSKATRPSWGIRTLPRCWHRGRNCDKPTDQGGYDCDSLLFAGHCSGVCVDS
jgi:hypothetical protein